MFKGKPDGHGLAVFIDRYFYKGSFKHGKMEGEGKSYNERDELIQFGSWKEGKFQEGRYVGFSRTSNLRYVEMKNGRFHVKFEDSSKYSGDGKIENSKFIIDGYG